MKKFAVALALATVAVAAVQADVTVTSMTAGKGLGQMASGQTVTYIKGVKMRTDQTVRGEVISSIIDVGAQQMIVLRSAAKEAEVYDLTRLSADLSKAAPQGEIDVKLTPNGQSKAILGQTASGYDLAVTVPMKMGDQTMAMKLAGPVWIVKGAPGAADYAAFYRAAEQKGLFFGSPEQVRGAPAQARGLAEMYRAFADSGGVPYATEVDIQFDGPGMMAQMMTKMGGMGFATTVTAVSTDAIPDDTFAVPAGYTTVKR